MSWRGDKAPDGMVRADGIVVAKVAPQRCESLLRQSLSRLLNPPRGVPPPTGEKMPPEKPPKQVVIGPDVAPPLPGALGGAPA